MVASPTIADRAAPRVDEAVQREILVVKLLGPSTASKFGRNQNRKGHIVEGHQKAMMYQLHYVSSLVTR
jgi:hypothetical protein